MKRLASPPEDDAAPAVDGRRARWAEHRQARRQELIDAAMDAIAEHGPSVGMDQIAAAAGTSKPVIYRYFADKADLYRAVVRQAAEELVAAVVASLGPGDPAAVADGHAVVAAGVRAYLGELAAQPQLYRFVVNHADPLGEGSHASLSEYTSMLGEVAAGLLAQRLAALGVDARVALPWGMGMIGFVRSAVDWWLDHPDTVTQDELAHYLTELLWGGAAGVGRLA